MNNNKLIYALFFLTPIGISTPEAQAASFNLTICLESVETSAPELTLNSIAPDCLVSSDDTLAPMGDDWWNESDINNWYAATFFSTHIYNNSDSSITYSLTVDWSYSLTVSDLLPNESFNASVTLPFIGDIVITPGSEIGTSTSNTFNAVANQYSSGPTVSYGYSITHSFSPTSEVPLPASIWLLVSGLTVLSTLHCRRKKRPAMDRLQQTKTY